MHKYKEFKGSYSIVGDNTSIRHHRQTKKISSARNGLASFRVIGQ